MRIQQLILENFRGFEKLEMDFPEGEGGLVVLVGVNGSGKTSVLEGLTGLLHSLYHRLFDSNSLEIEDCNLVGHQHDIKKEKDGLKNRLTLNIDDLDIVLSYSLFKNGAIVMESDPPFVKNEDNKLKYDYKLTEDILKNNPLFIHYPANRFIDRFPKLTIKDITKPSNFKAFENAFNSKLNFNFFFEWFRNAEDYESELIRFNKNSEFRLKSLQSVRNAISVLLPQFSNFRVQRQPKEDFILEKNDVKLSITNLSDGEKIVLSIFGDIARRLAISNEALENPLHGHGIVLIDEIELHLHPSWQRKIIPALTRAFKNVQFIVTTHSPQVISTVPKENVFLLEDFKLVEKTPYTEGRDSNNILFNIFGVRERPKIAREEFQKLYEFLDKEDVDAVKANIKDLEIKYGEDDPDLIEAKGHIRDFFEFD